MRDLEVAVAAEWEKNGQTQEAPVFEFLIDLPESWLPEWYDSQTCEYTSDMEREEKEILALFNEEFQTVWNSYYEDHLSWLEEEREFEDYLRNESIYW